MTSLLSRLIGGAVFLYSFRHAFRTSKVLICSSHKSLIIISLSADRTTCLQTKNSRGSQMNINKKVLVVAIGVIGLSAVLWHSGTIQGSPKTYEVRPRITVPEYRTDAARAIDAYERVMQRHMDLTEKNLLQIDTNVGYTVMQLDSIDDKLTQLCARVTRIEKALGIEAASDPPPEVPQAEPLETKPLDETAQSPTERTD